MTRRCDTGENPLTNLPVSFGVGSRLVFILEEKDPVWLPACLYLRGEDYWEAVLTNAAAEKENELPQKDGLFVQSRGGIKKLPRKLTLNPLLTCSSSDTMTETRHLQQRNPRCSFRKARK